jgi:phosphoribulokinase
MDFAIQLIFTPMIVQLMERKKWALPLSVPVRA